MTILDISLEELLERIAALEDQVDELKLGNPKLRKEQLELREENKRLSFNFGGTKNRIHCPAKNN